MANTNLKTRIVLRSDSVSGWSTAQAAHPSSLLLAKGEIGIEFTPGAGEGSAPSDIKIKIGDGVRNWANLPYFMGDIRALLDTKVDKVTGKSLVDDAEIAKLLTVAEGATKVEVTEKTGKISINGTEKNILPDDVIRDANYKHITVSATGGVTAGSGESAVTYKYDDTALTGRVTKLEVVVGDENSGLVKAVADNAAAIEAETDRAEAAEGVLSDRIDNLEARGRFLSSWDTTTGLPGTYPTVPTGVTEYTYSYKSGDYYIVSTVGTGTNYRPAGDNIKTLDAGTSWIIGKAVETKEVAAGDYYTYDGSKWVLVSNTQKSVTFANIAGNARDNASLLGEFTALETSIATKADQTDLDALESRVIVNETNIAKKVDKEITSTAGKAIIFNEADGGGAKFEKADGTNSFVGVNDSSNGVAAQIYAVDKNTLVGPKLDVTKDAIYYSTSNSAASVRDVEANRLAVQGDITSAVSAEATIREAADTTLQTNIDAEATTRETADTALQTAITNEATRATGAETTLQSNITAEETARIAADNTKTDKQVVGTNGTSYMFNEADGGGAKFTHNDGTESFVGVNDGGKDGLVAQIYADRLVDGKWSGAKLDVTNGGMYYTVGDKSFSDRAKPENEVATKGNIEESAATKQDKLTAGVGISSTQLASNTVALDLEQVILDGGNASDWQ